MFYSAYQWNAYWSGQYQIKRAVVAEVSEQSVGGSANTEKYYEKLKNRTEKIIRSATQIQANRIAARKALKVEKLEKRREQEVKLFTESALLTDQIKQEIIRLGLLEHRAQLAKGYLIREQIEQLEQQIEEIDMVFVTFMLIASIDK